MPVQIFILYGKSPLIEISIYFECPVIGLRKAAVGICTPLSVRLNLVHNKSQYNTKRIKLLAARGIKSDTLRSFSLITFSIVNVLTSLYNVKSIQKILFFLHRTMLIQYKNILAKKT